MEQKKYRQIKTIRRQMEYAERFDEEVNEALREGWYLAKRYAVPMRVNTDATWLVAELQRYVDHE